MTLGLRRRSFPQFNWSVVAPLTVALALLVGASGFVYGLIAPDEGADSRAAQHVAGTGGGMDLRAPESVKSKVFSLSARVTGSPTIRKGPGTQYDEVFRVTDGQEFHIVACDPGCSWFRLMTLDGAQWWLPSTFLAVSGNVDELPVLAPTESR